MRARHAERARRHARCARCADRPSQGIALDGERKARFNEIEQELAALSTRFSNNLLDSVKSFSLRLDKAEQVAGLPPSARAMLATSARTKGDADASAEKGPWLVTLDQPSLMAVLRFAEDRALRETVYRAYITRASELASNVPPAERAAQDNGPLIDRVLALRAERAALLGRASHAEVSVASKMATVDGARALLEQLLERSLGAARAEHVALCDFAGVELRQWDIALHAEKLKTANFQFDEEAVRQYLPLEAVLNGLFALVERLFGVAIAQVEPEAVGAQVLRARARRSRTAPRAARVSSRPRAWSSHRRAPAGGVRAAGVGRISALA